jgi:hypothetical protein
MSGQPDALEFHFLAAPTSGRKITRVAVSVKKRLLGIVVKRLRTGMNRNKRILIVALAASIGSAVGYSAISVCRDS